MAFRGTETTLQDWRTNVKIRRKSGPYGKVHPCDKRVANTGSIPDFKSRMFRFVNNNEEVTQVPTRKWAIAIQGKYKCLTPLESFKLTCISGINCWTDVFGQIADLG